MKPLLFLLLIFACSNTAFAQTRLPEYKASNGITYHEKDTIKLGRGSANNGDFLFLQMGGWAMSMEQDANNIGRHMSGTNVILKKIFSYKRKGAEKIYFAVGGGNISNYNLYIEDAIASCEVAACLDKNSPAAPSADKYDQLKKLKSLLDEGVINQEEFDKEKEKILAN